MRPTNNPLPPEFHDLLIVGFDESGKKEKKPPAKEDDNSDDDDSDDDDEGEGNEGDKSTGNEGLKSALQKERRERRKLEKENRRLAAAQKSREDSEKDETTKAKDEASAAQTKAAKLATRLRDTKLDNSIIKLANGMNFVDVDDALRLIDRDAVELDQDEDDPSDIEIDEKSVKVALEALLKAKPHLLKGEQQKPPPPKSGSKTGGGEKSKEQLDEEALASKYPALRRSSRRSNN